MQKLIYVPLQQSLYRDIVVIGTSPSEMDEKQRQPFCDEAGQLLRDTFAEVGFDINQVAYTNVIKVRPEDDRQPTPEEIESWLPVLREDLVSADRVILVGTAARQAFQKLDYDRFAFSSVDSINAPAYVLRQPARIDEWKQQIKQIARRIYGPSR